MPGATSRHKVICPAGSREVVKPAGHHASQTCAPGPSSARAQGTILQTASDTDRLAVDSTMNVGERAGTESVRPASLGAWRTNRARRSQGGAPSSPEARRRKRKRHRRPDAEGWWADIIAKRSLFASWGSGLPGPSRKLDHMAPYGLPPPAPPKKVL